MTIETTKMSYYEKRFKQLIDAGVPKWYIRLYVLPELAEQNRVYVYCDPYNVEREKTDGWYTTNGSPISGNGWHTEADKNRKCYGEIASLGFPTWDEYRELFDGDEYDSSAEYTDAYDKHEECWLEVREEERNNILK